MKKTIPFHPRRPSAAGKRFSRSCRRDDDRNLLLEGFRYSGWLSPSERRLCTTGDKMVSRLPPLDLVSNSPTAYNILCLNGFWRLPGLSPSGLRRWPRPRRPAALRAARGLARSKSAADALFFGASAAATLLKVRQIRFAKFAQRCKGWEPPFLALPARRALETIHASALPAAHLRLHQSAP